MSLNWVMLDERKKPVPLPNERSITTIPNAQVTIHIPTPSDNNNPSTTETLTATGHLWLTSDRVSRLEAWIQIHSLAKVCIPPANEAPTRKLESLSLPWVYVLSTSFVQPYFAANYLAVDVRPAEGGGLTLGTKAEVRLTDRGMFEFINMVESVRSKAIERAREARLGEPLPMYDQPLPGTAPPTEDLPPGYTA
ncbi:hypothetical protein RSAG8_03539, partial [Rhizoctonia solani AG-8 WAC10335]